MNLTTAGSAFSNTSYIVYNSGGGGGGSYGTCYVCGDTYGDTYGEESDVHLSNKRYQELLAAEMKLKRILAEQKRIEEQTLVSRRRIEI